MRYRYHRRSSAALPLAGTEYLGRLWPLCFQLVALHAKSFDLGLHALEQHFGRSCRDTGSLQREDVLALTPQLQAHVVDFSPNMIERWHVVGLRYDRPYRTNREQNVKPLGVLLMACVESTSYGFFASSTISRAAIKRRVRSRVTRIPAMTCFARWFCFD